MGECSPEAQTKGFELFSFIALICKRCSATNAAVSLFMTMGQKYKVFYNDTVIILTEDNSAEVDVCTDLKQVENEKQLWDFLNIFFEKDHTGDLCLKGYSLAEMERDFKSWFKFVHAAGGVVLNPENKYLFIKRFNMWDLPKGKMEKGESPQEAAAREVEEETGVEGLKITGELPSTCHIYHHNEKWILKKTFWFRMRTDFTGMLTPQLKEDITEAVWLTPEQSKQALSESYRSLDETLAPFLD